MISAIRLGELIQLKEFVGGPKKENNIEKLEVASKNGEKKDVLHKT